jgi:hypothetical protein
VEFKEGAAAVKFPVWSQPTVVWQHRNLGALLWSVGEKEIQCAVSGGYSIGWISYKSRALFFPVSNAVEKVELTQFLLRAAPTAIVDSQQGLSIKVVRDIGNEEVQKPDLISPLSSDLDILLELGRVQMDLGMSLSALQINAPFTDCKVGDAVLYFNHESGEGIGIVSSVQHGMGEEGDLQSVLTLRKVR